MTILSCVPVVDSDRNCGTRVVTVYTNHMYLPFAILTCHKCAICLYYMSHLCGMGFHVTCAGGLHIHTKLVENSIACIIYVRVEVQGEELNVWVKHMNF